MTGKPYHHGDQQRQLVEAARSLVEAEGSQAVRIARVAKACGVSVAAPHRHFADEEALLGAVAGAGFTELARVLGVMSRRASPPALRAIDSWRLGSPRRASPRGTPTRSC